MQKKCSIHRYFGFHPSKNTLNKIKNMKFLNLLRWSEFGMQICLRVSLYLHFHRYSFMFLFPSALLISAHSALCGWGVALLPITFTPRCCPWLSQLLNLRSESPDQQASRFYICSHLKSLSKQNFNFFSNQENVSGQVAFLLCLLL